MKTTLLTMFLGATLAMGCGSKDDSKGGDKPAGIANDDDYIKQGQAAVDKMIGIFKADGTNCDKLADDLDKLHSDNAALETYEKAHPDAKKKFDDIMKNKEKDMMEAVMPAMTACKDNKKLTDVMNKFN